VSRGGAAAGARGPAPSEPSVGSRPPERPGGGAYRADIEGLRAVAVVLVVAFHIGIDRFFGRYSIEAFGGGFIGVDVFYVISGFLITGLLLREMEGTGRISLRRFYAWRIKRLLPVATLVIVVTLVASWILLPPIDLSVVSRDAMAAVLYASNVRFALQATDYLAADQFESPLLHYWSLSLEEQYYLLWPGILFLTAAVIRSRTRWNARAAVGVLVVAFSVPSYVGSIVLTSVSAPWAYFGLPTRAWELGIGAGLALGAPYLRRLPPALGHWCAVVGLSAIIGSFAMLSRASAFPGWVAIFPVVGTALVIAGGSTACRGGVPALLGLRPFTYVGRLSYSWYLWHWPFITLAGPATGATGRPPASVVLAAAGLSFVAAMASHAWVEAPLRRRRSLAVGWRPIALAGGSIALVTVVAAPMVGSTDDAGATTAAGARLDRVRALDRCAANYDAAQARACEFGDRGAATTVVLVGDSHAEAILPALQEAARTRDWRILLFTKGICPPFDVRTQLKNYHREYTECSQWRSDVWKQLEQLRPSLVLLTRYGVYADDLIDDRGEPVPMPRAPLVWRQGVESTLQRLTPRVDAVVLLRDSPDVGFDVPGCISKHGKESEKCNFARDGRVHYDETLYSAERAAARRISGVHEVDLSRYICDTDPCSVIDRSGVIKYRDSNHLTATFSASLGPALGQELDRVIRRRAPAGLSTAR
jgi:peptidoglycan/LPS O-acetylase OafA/YrhL